MLDYIRAMNALCFLRSERLSKVVRERVAQGVTAAVGRVVVVEGMFRL